jgi:hypothetical protein
MRWSAKKRMQMRFSLPASEVDDFSLDADDPVSIKNVIKATGHASEKQMVGLRHCHLQMTKAGANGRESPSRRIRP